MKNLNFAKNCGEFLAEIECSPLGLLYPRSHVKEFLLIVGVVIVGTAVWFARGYGDWQVISSKDEANKLLQDAMHSKDATLESKIALLGKNSALMESKDQTIKTLQATINSKDDVIAKNASLLNSKEETIRSLGETLHAKEDLLAKDEDIITNLQTQISTAAADIKSDAIQSEDGEKIYPRDNGFDSQDLGSGSNAFHVFSAHHDPKRGTNPSEIPNHTPWVFGSDNSGIAANGSAYFVNGASNHDSSGSTSSAGQAGVIEYKGSSISQLVALPAGTYTISFDYEARQNYTANQVAVSLDRKELFKGTPSNSNNFERVTTDAITLTTPGKFELKFRGLGGESTYPATFIDNITINVVGPKIVPSTTSADASGQPKQLRNVEIVQAPIGPTE